jgi:hypothetical protein
MARACSPTLNSAGTGVHDGDGRGSRPFELVGVEGGRNVALQDTDAHRAAELLQRALEQRRLAGTR